jgi:hypothetical protein
MREVPARSCFWTESPADPPACAEEIIVLTIVEVFLIYISINAPLPAETVSRKLQSVEGFVF